MLVRKTEERQMRQNICHKIANESLFVGFAVALLTVIAIVAYSAVWPSIIVLFTLRAAHDFSQCDFSQATNYPAQRHSNSRGQNQKILRPLNV